MAGRKVNYFFIGLFVLLGLALLVAALLFWGAKKATKNVLYTETYFNESVQGLSVGSPVKYRGMQIGNVTDIAPISSVYDFAEAQTLKGQKTLAISTYIYVKMALSPRFLNITNNEEEFRDKVNAAIAKGLRAKLSIQGLTGSAFIDLDFNTAASKTPLPISWTPENPYIPSTPSTLAFFGDNAEYLLDELRKIDLPKTFSSLQDLIKSTNETVDNTNKYLMTFNKQIMEMMANLQGIAQNVKQLSERTKDNPSSILFSSPPSPLNLNKL